MIGRDNCRFSWGHPDGPDEPTAPFHGVIYPDGHPWDVGEVKGLSGDVAFAAREGKLFRAEDFDGEFRAGEKSSVTPRIDFDPGDEPGTGSPDASAGIGKDGFAVRRTGRMVVPAAGPSTLYGDSDGLLRLRGRSSWRGPVVPDQIRVEYVHRGGAASAHVSWRGPRLDKQILTPGVEPGSVGRGGGSAPEQAGGPRRPPQVPRRRRRQRRGQGRLRPCDRLRGLRAGAAADAFLDG